MSITVDRWQHQCSVERRGAAESGWKRSRAHGESCRNATGPCCQVSWPRS